MIAAVVQVFNEEPTEAEVIEEEKEMIKRSGDRRLVSDNLFL